MAATIEVLGKVEAKLCKMSGVGKDSGKPYTMLTFNYFDPYLNKDISLKPALESDKMALDLIYIKGWTPPQT